MTRIESTDFLSASFGSSADRPASYYQARDKGLMGDLLCTNLLPAGKTKLTDWTREHKDTLGVRYASELARCKNREKAYNSSKISFSLEPRRDGDLENTFKNLENP